VLRVPCSVECRNACPGSIRRERSRRDAAALRPAIGAQTTEREMMTTDD
jgi:hypothetical protein